MTANHKISASVATDPNELISVSLKTLINLAKPAEGLKQAHLGIKAQQSGGYQSSFKGRGMEFDEVRLYQPGDDIRRIDWRVTARTDQTYTKVYREERERPVFISVDNRPTMHFATRGTFKSVLAAKLAALLAWTAHHHSDRIGGQIFDAEHCQELKPRNGKQAVLRFLNALVNQGDQVPTSEIQAKLALEKQNAIAKLHVTLDVVMSRLLQHVKPGSLVYIISDFRGLDDKTEEYLTKLHRHCDVVLVFVYDALEKELPNKGRYRFTDNQRDIVIDTSQKQHVQHYLQHFNARWQRLEQLAKSMNFTLIQCSTSQNPVMQLK